VFPLSSKEKADIKALAAAAAESGKVLKLTDEAAQSMADMLELLCDRGVLLDLNVDNENWYAVQGDFSTFEEWVKDQEKKAKKLTRREWMIAIISAVIGAVIGLTPTIVDFIAKLMEKGV